MYHFLVAQKTRGMFEKLNEADSGVAEARVPQEAGV